MSTSSGGRGGTRAALLTAARSRFATLGFEACRLTDLCADAALTTGALYRSFSSKDALLATLVDDMDEELAALGREGDENLDVTSVASGWLTALRRHRGALRASVELALTRGEGIERRRHQRELLVDHLHAALAGHRHRDAAASMAADTLEYIGLAEALGWFPQRLPRLVGATLAHLLASGVSGGVEEVDPDVLPPTRIRREDRMHPVLHWRPGPGRATPSTPRGNGQVATILAAATDVFGEVGMGSTTIEEIAGRAGVASGTVYRYFTDKADVLSCLAVRVERVLYETAVLPTDSAGRFAPDDAIAAYLATRRQHLGVFRAWREDAITGGGLADAWVAMRSEFARGVAGTVLDGQARSVACPTLDAAVVGEVVVAIFEQSSHSRIELGLDPHIDDATAASVIGSVLGDGLGSTSR